MFLSPKQTTGKIVFGCLAVIVLGVGACSVPSDIEMEIGQAMEMSLVGQIADDEYLMQEALNFAGDLPGVDNVSVNEMITPEGKVVQALIWGEEMDAKSVEAQMKSRFPALADAEVIIKPLEGVVHGNLAERIGHSIFDLDVRGGSEEEIRQQILEQLAAQGFTGRSEIRVHSEDGQQLIDIELSEDEEN